MWLMLVGLSLAMIVPMVMGMMSMMLSGKKINSESFECGFDSFNVSIFPMSLRFFMFCLIFLILDLELIIMAMIPMVMWSSGFILNLVVFLILVTISLLSEWLFGSLSWVE